MSTEQQFNADDRVEWLGFIKENRGEATRPIGTRGTITQLGSEWRGTGVNVAYIEWDGSSRVEGTWVENVRLVNATEPVEVDPELRERMLDMAVKAAEYGDWPSERIVAAAAAFEAYVTGVTK